MVTRSSLIAWAMLRAPSGNRTRSDSRPIPMMKIETSTSVSVTPLRGVMASVPCRWLLEPGRLAVLRVRVWLRVPAADHGCVGRLHGHEAGAQPDGDEQLLAVK